MKLQKITPLARQMLIMVATIVVAMTGAFLTYFIIQTRQVFDATLTEEGKAISNSIASTSEEGVANKDPLFLKKTFDALESHTNVVFIAAYGQDGHIIHTASNIVENIPGPHPFDIARVISGQSFRGTIIRVGNLEIDDYYAPVIPTPTPTTQPSVRVTPTAIGFIRMGMSRVKISAVEKRSITFSLLVAAVVMAAGILTASILSRRLVKPLVELQNMTKRISEGDLDAKLPVNSNDEIGVLSAAFNAMTQALRQTTVSRNYIDNILTSMNDALVVVSPEQAIAIVNKYALSLLGYDTEELIGRPLNLLFMEYPIDNERWEKLLAGETLSNIASSLRAKDGSSIVISLSMAPIFERQWRFTGAVIVARDIRESQRLLGQLKAHADDLERHREVLTSMLEDNEAARSLVEGEHLKMQAAVDSMVEGIVIFTATGDIALINPAARQMLQFGDDFKLSAEPIATALGIDLRTLIEGNNGPHKGHLLHDISIGETSPHIIRVEGAPVMYRNEHIGSILVLRDITRERQLDEAKHELITNVSHELRTPLAAIANIVSNILVGVTGPIGDKLRSHLNIANVNTKRLTNIIDNLLDIASLDTGRAVINKKMTDFSKIAQEATTALHPEIDQKLIKFNLSLPRGSLVVYCDAMSIGQVIRNLLNNAVRYTPQGGSVEVTVEAIAGNIQVTVQDTGIGIPTDEQKFIFERFHQIGRTYGPGEKGLGLGLPISRQLIEMHGGSIGVTSMPGKGSRFYFRIPYPIEEELIVTVLSDHLKGMSLTGDLPCLWLFTPNFLAEKTLSSFDDKIVAAALGRIESALHFILGNLNYVIAKIASKNEVAVVVSFESLDDLERTSAKITAAMKQLIFDHEGKALAMAISIGQLVCSDNKAKPRDLLDTIRKKNSASYT